MHTPSLSNTLPQPYSTPRQFTTAVHERPDHEKFKSMRQTESPLLGSSVGHVTHVHDEDINNLASPTQAVPDLPTWTPLRTLGDNEGSEVDQPSAWEATGSAEVKQHRGSPINAQAAAQNTVTAKRTLKTSFDATPSKRKKARFDGVLIVTKPPFYRTHSSRAQPGPAAARTLSLVDALARTFDANRHSEDPFPRPSHSRDDASTVSQTDVETTEAEGEQRRLNTRLVRTPLKRHHTRTNASETNSEDAASLLQAIPQPERPVKRLKPIQYESNPALIDAALGTAQAPIGWDAEVDIIVRNDDFVNPALTARVPSADGRMDVEEGDRIATSPKTSSVLPSAAVENEWRMPTFGGPKETVLSPYLSCGAKFRQRLEAIFGENTTVRTDRVARPRPADHDLFALLDEPDRDSSPNTGETTVSVSSASGSNVEEGASAIPSTHITSQSPDIPPSDTSIVDLLPGNQLDEVASFTKPTPDAVEEQMSGWITTLQRLVKGKVRVKEEDLEALSIILAEIESVKDSLDGSVLMNSELRESVKQLSQLHEIPFGDRNKLRQRAENIFRTWPSIGSH
ncbi:hypothetical protein J3R83DRAFT_485 [Lanmaoa asiatica]|nr:hypothetical protein J3R83DRAFT_485 [Lanmaoa asiatica]